MHICHRWCTELTVSPLDFVLGNEEDAQETASADMRQRPGKDNYAGIQQQPGETRRSLQLQTRCDRIVSLTNVAEVHLLELISVGRPRTGGSPPLHGSLYR